MIALVSPMVTLLVAVLVVAALVGLLSRRSSTGYRKFQEGRVLGIAGRKGHGKTLFSVHELLRHVGSTQRCRECSDVAGRKVTHPGFIASNGNLRLPDKLAHLYRHVDGWDDLFDLPHCSLVVIDEAHLWAPAIQGKEGQLPERVRWLLSQCRKLHLEIIWVSQAVDRVALGVRRQTDEVGVCRRGMFRQMRVNFYEPENVGKLGQKPLWVYRYRVTRRLAASYNTYELLMPEASTSRDSLDAQLVDAVTLKGRQTGAPAPVSTDRPSAPSIPRVIDVSAPESQ